MLTITAPAKINLALDVLARRSDGYHEVDLICQTIALADRVNLTDHSRLELSCSDPRLPLDQSNLVWQATRLLQETSGVNRGVKIHLEKRIPVAAGLAGGSADAAAVLTGLNQLWKLGLSPTKLIELGVKLGADVPFCLLQGTARARGIGERLTPIASRLDCQLLLVTPKLEVATAWAYQQLDLAAIQYHPKIDQVVAALEAGDPHQLVAVWGNLLEEVVVPKFPEIAQVKEVFRRHGLIASLMSGSGPTIFALDPPVAKVQAIEKELPVDWFKCVTRFQNCERVV